ncbi:MAG: ribonuclease R [Oscillospiraceae bacterium]
MPIKEKILKELEKAPQKFKALKMKFKGSKKFMDAMDELYKSGIIDEVNGYVKLVRVGDKKKPLSHAQPSPHSSEQKTGQMASTKVHIEPIKLDKEVVVKKPEEEFVRGSKENLVGKIVKLTENYGFVRVEGIAKDIFVAGKFMMGAIVGDTVEIEKVPSRRHQFEGEVVAILKEKTNLVGTIEKKAGKFFVTPKDCPTLSLPVENRGWDFHPEDVVLINVLGRGRGHRSLTAKVTENVGIINSSEKSVTLLLSEKQVQREFEPQVIEEAAGIISRLDMKSEYEHRTDLTNKPIFTIDSDKTKDIDDAISIEKTAEGYNLGVHIADVSYFVRPASFVNQAAFARGTSIYFGENVIPMLPREYSNGVCSLNPNEERLAFTCDMFLDESGTVKSYKFYKSVVKSKVKGVYSEINTILDGSATEDIKKKYDELTQSIFLINELYEKLDKKRDARGSMDIESDEAQIIFDKKGKAVDVVKRERGQSEKIIEECMLLANGCSANLAKKLNIPFVYRVHPAPDPEKLYVLKDNLKKFGLRLEVKKDGNMQQALSKLLDESRGTKLERFIHMGVLRSQAKAKYSEIPQGHFGLALEDYSHFTSPIRRYPDLAIHRILTDVVNGVSKDKIKKKYEKFAKAASEQSSNTELDAMQVERDAMDIYKAEYMCGHIGETFKGTVSSVTTFGVYVALENTVEGLVHVSVLGMATPTLQEGYSLSCPVSGKKYVIGDQVMVKVLGADIFNGNIDLQII